jgi:hypothetical protein
MRTIVTLAAILGLSHNALAQCAVGYTAIPNTFACLQNAGAATFGSSTIPTGDTQSYSGGQWGTAFAAPINGTLQSISVYMSATSGTIALALYALDGAGATPGSLLANTGVFAPVSGWNTIAITGGPTLTAGTSYFLAYLGVSGSPTIQRVDTSASGRSWFSSNFALTSVLDPFPTFVADVATWPLYGTLQ